MGASDHSRIALECTLCDLESFMGIKSGIIQRTLDLKSSDMVSAEPQPLLAGILGKLFKFSECYFPHQWKKENKGSHLPVGSARINERIWKS